MADPLPLTGVVVTRDEGDRIARCLRPMLALCKEVIVLDSGSTDDTVAIARSLCMEPRILLFDEPTSALDPEMVREVLDVMQTLARDGMTMVVVTHEVGFARQVAHRVVLMADGEVVEEAHPQQFFTAPAQERSRRFLEQIL